MFVSPTLAASEVMAQKRAAGERILALSFGEAGLPVLPAIQQELAANAHRNSYGPVAGVEVLREAVAGYWSRRQLPTSPDRIVCGPGSKSLLYALILAIDADVALPRPSWVSYAAQAALAGRRPVFVPTRVGEGGVPDPVLLEQAVIAARDEGRRVGAVVVTVPDNPTGTCASADTVRQLCEVADRQNLVVISDEIYRDLMFPDADPVTSPAEFLPDRVVITTGLSKNLALGGWRIGAARLMDGVRGAQLCASLIAIGSEVWSSPSQPVQWAAALAYTEPEVVQSRMRTASRIYSQVTNALAECFRTAGCTAPTPRGAFYLYPDFGPLSLQLQEKWRIGSGPSLADFLLRERGISVLPGNAFGDSEDAVRLRVATSLLLGETSEQRDAVLRTDNPVALPWISDALIHVNEVLAEIA